MKNPEFRERLALLIGDESPFGWANRLGISNGAWTRIWNEGTMPKVEHLQKIKLHTGASLDWIIDGEGMPPNSVLGIEELEREASLAFMSGDTEKYEHINQQVKEKKAEYFSSQSQAVKPEIVSDDFVLVPRHDVIVSGGNGAAVNSEQIVDYFAFNKQWVRQQGLHAKDLVLVEVIGDSMTPVLSSGDTVLVDMSQTDLKTGAAYVIRLGDELLVKYVQRLPGERIQISSENRNAYPSFEIELDKFGHEIEVIGRVINSSRSW